MAPAWDELAGKFNGNGEWTVAKVDCTVEKATCAKYGVKGYPTLKALKDGKTIDYAGARSVGEFEKFLAKNGPNAAAAAAADAKPADAALAKNDKGVWKITNGNIDAVTSDAKISYFIKFFAPWCGHCKNMAADWESFATTNTDESLRVAEVDCTTDADACQKHGVRGYPTVLLFNGDAKNPIKFQGARNKAAFTEFWANNKKGGAKTEL